MYIDERCFFHVILRYNLYPMTTSFSDTTSKIELEGKLVNI